MSKQTAVKWLVEQMINKMGIRIENTTIGVELFEQAQGMFEEQIMNAVDVGFQEGCKFPEDIEFNNAEQYYNETFNNQTP